MKKLKLKITLIPDRATETALIATPPLLWGKGKCAMIERRLSLMRMHNPLATTN
jgi:hypothetical protein